MKNLSLILATMFLLAAIGVSNVIYKAIEKATEHPSLVDYDAEEGKNIYRQISDEDAAETAVAYNDVIDIARPANPADTIMRVQTRMLDMTPE